MQSCEDAAQELVRHQDRGLDPRLLDVVDPGRVGIVGGVVQLEHGAVALVHAVDHRGRGDDDVEVELALEPLLDDLEVQQAEKAAAEAEAQGRAALRLVLEAGVVEPQLAQAVAQIAVIVGVGRVHAAEHDRLARPEAGQRRRRRACGRR